MLKKLLLEILLRQKGGMPFLVYFFIEDIDFEFKKVAEKCSLLSLKT